MAYAKTLVVPTPLPLQKLTFPVEYISPEIDTSTCFNAFMTLWWIVEYTTPADAYFPPVLDIQGRSSTGNWASIQQVPLHQTPGTVGIVSNMNAGITSIAATPNEITPAWMYVSANATPAVGEFVKISKSTGAAWSFEDPLVNSYVQPITLKYWAGNRFLNIPVLNAYRTRIVVKARSAKFAVSTMLTDMTDAVGSVTLMGELLLNSAVS
jgi:hypothetical protein